MALNRTVVVLYVVDILYYTVIDDSRGNWGGELQKSSSKYVMVRPE
jgi:hypothetical protein